MLRRVDRVQNRKTLNRTTKLAATAALTGFLCLSLLAGGASAAVSDCGSTDGVALPCWTDFKDSDAGDESLPYYPYAVRPNGCSIPGAKPGSRDTLHTVAPPGFTFSYKAACNNHDRCYYTVGTNAAACNRQFSKDLLKACEKATGKPREPLATALLPAAKSECKTRAAATVSSVRAVQGKYHPEAQRKQQRYLARVEQYVAEHPAASPTAFNGNYRIVNTWRCPDNEFCNWNLSWTDVNPHPKATVENDGFAWEIKPIAGKRNHYKIRNKWRCPDQEWCNAELSWDAPSVPTVNELLAGVTGHPLATVEHNDPVEWKITPDPTGKAGHYLIQSMHGCPSSTACGWNLSWDTERPHPRASIENDGFTWKIIAE